MKRARTSSAIPAASAGGAKRPRRALASATSSASATPTVHTVVVDSEYRPTPELYTAGPPTRDARGRLSFPDAPALFAPNLTPAEVLRAGAFGGGYFRNIYSSITKTQYVDAWRELPADWLAGLDVKRVVARQAYAESANHYGVKCGAGLDEWESSGWITKWDPYGFFMWYCRFYQGRRCADDGRQIARWAGVAGEKGRWKNNLIAKCVAAGKRFDDASVAPVVRQTLHHWAYKLDEKDHDAYARKVRRGAKTAFISSAPSAAK